jgi:hypothetical protein
MLASYRSVHFLPIGLNRVYLCVAALVFAQSPTVLSAQATDTLRGRVTTDSGVAVAGAEVVATRGPDRAYKSVVTDQEGRYFIVFEEGTGDYLLHASAIGRATERIRIRRIANESSLVHDFQLRSSIQRLETVRVSAEKNKPERDVGRGSEPGESGKRTDGVTGGVSPDALGNIATVASTVPGVMLTPNGPSVLGLNADQSRTTLNGMAFSGTDLPRNARTEYRVNGSTYDPSHGWFSGALVDAELQPGATFSSKNATLTLAPRSFQFGDGLSSELGYTFSNVVAGVGGSGPFAREKMLYSYGIDIKRRRSHAPALQDASAELLQYAGVAPDSVARLRMLLTVAGIPVVSIPEGFSKNSDDVVFLGRIDHASRNPTTFAVEKQTWGLVAYAKAAHIPTVGATPTAFASHASENSQQIFGVQGTFSTYLHNDAFLTEVRTAFNLKRDRTTPYLNLPEGDVLVGSELPTSLSAITTLAFGGNPLLEDDTHDWTWQTSSVTRFYTSARSEHRLQLTGESRIDGFSDGGRNNSGAFMFNSLADFSANSPSSFTRTLQSPRSTGAEWNGFVSLGDYWRKSRTFQVLYGLRLEGNRFLDRPPYNPDVERVFDARTDYVPTRFEISPRFGFTWIRVPGQEGVRFSPVGVFNIGHPSYLRGGVGEFRNMLPVRLLAQPMVANGLSNGRLNLSCIGPAVPIPNWRSYAADPSSAPRECVSTDGSPSFSDTTPSVYLFSRSYLPSTSWRANLAYASSFRWVSYSIEGLYSLNVNQPSYTNINFTGAQKFTTFGESRPVFVSTNGIVTSTGLASPVEGRSSSAFGTVISNRSDSRSISRQATFVVLPDLQKFTNWVVSVGYTLGSVRTYSNGFTTSTFASPFMREWSRGDLDVRHQIVLQAGRRVKGATVSLFGHINSGFPFTPLVAGDVNADGLSNDRAFIFDPEVAPDSGLRADLKTLTSEGPAWRRSCLTRQVRHAVARNSCEGPWTATLNAQLTKAFEVPHSMGRYATVAIAVTNPLGGLDRLVHGNAHLHGWGAPGFPDPILYNVRGFNNAIREFRYEVNPRFGTTQPSGNVNRAPLRLTLDISIPVGTPLPMQQLERWVSAARGGKANRRLTRDELKIRFSRSVPDPYQGILEQSDSLLLTPEQEKALQEIQGTYLRAIDSLWTPLSEYFADLGESFDVKDALKQQETTIESVWEYTRQDLRRSLPGILTPIQLKLLPFPAGYLYNSKEKKIRLRLFMG